MMVYKIFKFSVFCCECVCVYLTSFGLYMMTNVYELTWSCIFTAFCLLLCVYVCVWDCTHLCVFRILLQGVKIAYSALYNLQKWGKNTGITLKNNFMAFHYCFWTEKINGFVPHKLVRKICFNCFLLNIKNTLLT